MTDTMTDKIPAPEDFSFFIEFQSQTWEATGKVVRSFKHRLWGMEYALEYHHPIHGKAEARIYQYTDGRIETE